MPLREEDIGALIDDVLRDVEHRSLRFREKKIAEQMTAHQFDFQDILYVLENRDSVDLMDGAGQRFLVRGRTIDDEMLSVVITDCQPSGLKVVNVYR